MCIPSSVFHIPYPVFRILYSVFCIPWSRAYEKEKSISQLPLRIFHDGLLGCFCDTKQNKTERTLHSTEYLRHFLLRTVYRAQYTEYGIPSTTHSFFLFWPLLDCVRKGACDTPSAVLVVNLNVDFHPTPNTTPYALLHNLEMPLSSRIC